MKNFLFLITIAVSLALSQNVNTGLPFLKMGIDARSIAMGEAFTSITNDHSAYYYNPAALRSTGQRQLLLGHRQGFAEMTSEYLGTTLPGEALTFGISAMTTAVNGIEVRLRPGDAEGTFSAKNGALSAGVGIAPTEDLSIGVAGKLLYEKIYIDEASGYAFDAGLSYQLSEEFHAGASVLNVGSMSVLRSERSPLPTTFRLGGSFMTTVAPQFSLLAAADLVKTLDDELNHLQFGAEITYDSMLMLRSGFQTGYEAKSFSAGVGVLYGIVRFDYAFVPLTGPFTTNHSFSLVFFL